MADWCGEHPRYSAKRKPNSLCGKCWALWFIRNPEFKVEMQETYGELSRLANDFNQGG